MSVTPTPGGLPLDSLALKGKLPFKIPNTIEDVTPELLTSILRGQGIIAATESVVTIARKIIGEAQGFTSVCVFAALTYSGEATGNAVGVKRPTEVVVKICGGSVADTPGLISQ